MYVKAKKMRTSMGVICRDLAFVFDDTQFDQTVSQNGGGFLIQFRERGSFMTEGKDLFLRLIYQVIDCLLFRGEFPRRWNGPGDIRGISVVFGAHIHQDHIPSDVDPCIFLIVEDASVSAAAHDAGVADIFRTELLMDIFLYALESGFG